MQNKDQPANVFLPLYPVFKDVTLHHVLADDLRATVNSATKEAAKLTIETKVKLLLVRLGTSVWITDI
jgi:hypothetical protein